MKILFIFILTKDLDLILEKYPTTSEKAIADKKVQYENEYISWLEELEYKIIDDEQELYTRIDKEEDTFFEFIYKEENKIHSSFDEAKNVFMNEHDELSDKFEDIETKITKRMFD